ncbi:hypothetical protein M422DRAFT_273649 [Sphaerobolus stellatus SS14]|uniref:Uncharacterized protein n=1 Tax=Sphaerobolus stellatus (strain SS14) TaxID=990650 RepID=A0A0C9T8R9_SPHS4|nr:hypothetical protein M422DRAFT_273649 [Sphaerobolus stellatus SS14]
MPLPAQLSTDIELRPDQRWCKWCQSAQSYQHFDLHIKACERLHCPLSISSKTRNSHKTPAQNTDVQSTIVSHQSNIEDEPEAVVEISELNEAEDVWHLPSGNFDIESKEENAPDLGGSTSPPVAVSNPKSFIEVFHHPHSGKERKSKAKYHFGTFEETMGTVLDVNTSLEAARKFGVPFQDGEVTHVFQSRTYTFKFKFRDTWEWILDLVGDATLSEQIMWYPVQKYLHNGFQIIRIYDELNSGEAWWEIQSSLPQEDGIPHCFLPLHLWVDKSKVSEKIKMHPIIVRACFLSGAIRNGSGNGGGLLVRYMPIVGDPNESAENEDDSAASIEIANFKPPQRARLSKNVDKMPRWRGLKHFKAVTSTEFTDGNSYKDILKIILPSVVDLLPANSALVHCIRLLGIMRAIAGLRVIREDQIEYLEDCLPRYEKYCISTTRPGEGFQQEVQQAYDQTNFRNAESQMVKIDENQEVIARIRMAVDRFDALTSLEREELDSTDGGPLVSPSETEAHWALGSPLSKCDPNRLEEANSQHPGFRRFTMRLTEFLSEVSDPEHRPTSPLRLTPYQCLYLNYRSLEDWREKRDILRCNPNFYGEPRFDCVVINTDPISFGRLQAIFTCSGANKKSHTVILVSLF